MEEQRECLSCVCFVDGSKSDSDDDRGPVFSTYSSSSAFDKLLPEKKGRDSRCPLEGALTKHYSQDTTKGIFFKGVAEPFISSLKETPADIFKLNMLIINTVCKSTKLDIFCRV